MSSAITHGNLEWDLSNPWPSRAESRQANPASFFTRRRLAIIVSLCVLTGTFLIGELAGLRTEHAFRLRGDLRREARAFEQYGQVACVVMVALLMWTLDPSRRRLLLPMGLTLLATLLVATALKHTVGRARPDKGDAAAFGVEMIENPSEGQSFPSGHSANAVALTVVLASLYPRGRYVFWGLALTCATLRYVNNAHWPSDVLAGITIGYVTATATWYALVERQRVRRTSLEADADSVATVIAD